VIAPSRLSLNQATVKSIRAPDAVDLCVRHGIDGIGLWRDGVQETGAGQVGALAADAGLTVSSLCRAGFFTHADEADRRRTHADNCTAIEEAAAVGTDVLILVSGGLVPGTRDLPLARRMIADGVAALVPRAQDLGVKLAIEALHPMFCADRCAISRLGQAIDLAQQFPADAVGVVVDTYHLWWDASLLDDIARAGERILSYQVSDWVLPIPADALLGRGHVGDGHIDFGPISEAVAAAGYDGMVEVEIFNQAIWDAPADETAAKVKARFDALIACR
jgi:sugar phosphate isomerase/epimerase